uniref:WRC domain-containing protein n=1 Tax=Manihot esculenta TaxID=3983 RepID=A0A2C9V7N3_MANES
MTCKAIIERETHSFKDKFIFSWSWCYYGIVWFCTLTFSLSFCLSDEISASTITAGFPSSLLVYSTSLFLRSNLVHRGEKSFLAPMRIRKRQVPFPLSSLSPLPLSDPHFSRSPVVQLQLNTNPLQNLPQQDQKPAFFDPQSVHQPNQPIGGGSNPQACSDGSATQEVKDFQKDKRGGGGGGGVGRSDNTRRGDFLGAESETVVHQLSNPSHQEVGRWCEGEKAFPLKKRRGNFERSKEEETTVMKDKKMKTKMNKKCLQRNANTEAADKEDKETKEGINGKKRIRGGALMEGSRCSRVNGRGWRCCQQTLVGYSLCEHHLGKGRLRSMTSFIEYNDEYFF